MALSKADIQAIKELLGRDFTLVEEHIFDTMWSEHCSYKSTKDTLKKYLPTTGKDVTLGIGEDSGIVHFTTHNGKRYGLAVSHESHNHPSQILPIEGAATGVGGVVRDVYCMGADVIGVLNSLHFGINDGNTPIVDEIAKKVVHGVCDYANPLGVPVMGGETLFHPSYNDNCLVNVAALGLVDEDHIIHSYVPEAAKTEPYDVILVGKSTDATGFGGASFSSATLDTDSNNIGAVQVHDPFLKRVIVEALKALFEIVRNEGIEIGCKDLGAGGIACATSEIAVAGGYGVTVDLDKVNVAIPELAPEIIACSETQERFCFVVPRTFTPRVLELFNETFAMPKLYPKAGAVVIGDIIPESQFILTYRGERVCDLPVEAITTEVKADRSPSPRSIPSSKTPVDPLSLDSIKSIGLSITSGLENRSKRDVYRFFDNAVRGDTVTYPGETDAVVVTPIEGCDTGVVVSMDSNLYGEVDPYISGAAAVAESVRNVISAGGTPLAVTDCLNYGNPEKGEAFFDFEEGVKGIRDACHAFGRHEGEPLPIISGNVSLYNESKNGTAIVPSPVIVVIGKVNNYRKTLTFQLNHQRQTLILVGKRHAEFAGTTFAKYHPLGEQIAPQVHFEAEAKNNKAVQACMAEGWVQSCHDIASGGLWQCISEMILGERGTARVGAKLHFEDALETALFSENGGYIISVKPEDVDKVTQTLEKNADSFQVIGETTDEKTLVISNTKGESLTVTDSELKQAWTTHLTPQH